ncbi:MAG: DUF58 domain-containing protein [candidate division Zixibacteria bacterium]|nr:DUF58 domain-containing protein [candidate division Zixibacteria bacterium]
MPNTDYRQFLNPETISKLKSMEMKARLVVEGFITGLHKSPYHGFSVEFAEHRQYMPGDPIRDIDWKVYAKSDRYYVKQFEEETNLKSYILLDTSASMSYTSAKVSKFVYAANLAAALAFLMLKQRDAVGLVTFDERVRQFVPPKSASVHLHALLTTLAGVEPQARTETGIALHEMAERIKRRGLIIVLSDLWDDPSRILTGLKHFRHRKHEVIVFHVLDPTEREFNFPEEALFRDMETGEEISTLPWQIRSEYQRTLGEHVDRYRRECRQAFVDYVPIDTSMPYDNALFTYLGKRARLY